MSHNLNGEKVLITGASGFIGSNLVRKIKAEGGDPYSVVRSLTSSSKIEMLKKHSTPIVVDLKDYDQVKEMIKASKPAYIIHAAQPPAPKELTDYTVAIFETTKNITNLLRAIAEINPAIRFVHTCSSMIYAWTPSKYILKENTRFDPTSMRGMLKLNERNICQYFHQQFGLDIRLARIFRAYGPQDSNKKLIMKAIEALDMELEIAVGSNKYKRDYLHIDDLCEGILRLATLSDGKWHEVNLGSGTCYGPEDIVAAIEEVAGKRIKRSEVDYTPNMYDLGRIEADIELAETLLGWKPKISIEDGLMKTMQWYKETKEKHEN